MAKLSNRFGTRPQSEIFNLPDDDDNLFREMVPGTTEAIDVRPFIQNKRYLCIINPEYTIFYTRDGSEPVMTNPSASTGFTPTSTHKNIQGFVMDEDMETLKLATRVEQHVSVLFYEV